MRRFVIDEQRAFHEFASIKAGENDCASKIENLSLKALSPYDALFREPIQCHCFAFSPNLQAGGWLLSLLRLVTFMAFSLCGSARVHSPALAPIVPSARGDGAHNQHEKQQNAQPSIHFATLYPSALALQAGGCPVVPALPYGHWCSEGDPPRVSDAIQPVCRRVASNRSPIGINLRSGIQSPGVRSCRTSR